MLLSKVSSRQRGPRNPVNHRQFALIEAAMDRTAQRRRDWDGLRQAGLDQARIGPGEEQDRVPAQFSYLVAMCAGPAFDQALQPRVPQVTGNLPRGELVCGQAQDRHEPRRTSLRLSAGKAISQAGSRPSNACLTVSSKAAADNFKILAG